MDKFLEKIKEGGYITGFRYDKLAEMDGGMRALEILLLDPLAWQALGKAEGWGAGEPYNGGNYETSHEGDWQRHWHSFIEHLTSGGTTDEFFVELLK